MAMDPKRKRSLITVAAIVAFLFAAKFIWGLQDGMRQENLESYFARQFQTFETPSPNMEFPPVTITGPDGREKAIAQYRGVYVLVNLWATWCPPCIAEIPSLQALSDHYKGKELRVISVSLDSGKTLEDLKPFLVQHNLGLVALHHDSRREIQRALRPAALPMTYLIDPQGRVVFIAGGEANWMSYESLAYLGHTVE